MNQPADSIKTDSPATQKREETRAGAEVGEAGEAADSTKDSAPTFNGAMLAEISTSAMDGGTADTAAADAESSRSKPHHSRSLPTARLRGGSSRRVTAGLFGARQIATLPNQATRGCPQHSLGSTDCATAIRSPPRAVTITVSVSSQSRSRQSTDSTRRSWSDVPTSSRLRRHIQKSA
jgi:hypothetical protein